MKSPLGFGPFDVAIKAGKSTLITKTARKPTTIYAFLRVHNSLAL